MPSFNKIIMIGNLTRDPQLTYLPSQTAVVDFGLATNRKWTGQDGQAKEEVCFVDCQAFGKTADNINKYFTKGKPILIEGRLKFDQWQALDGAKRSKHRITVEKFTFVGGNSSEQGTNSTPQDRQDRQDHNDNQGPPPDNIPF